MQRVLFVCTGNTCRSPMAEAIANDLFGRKQLRYQAFSRGLNVLVPSRASDNAIKALRFLYKLDIEAHISRQITAADLENATIVLTMTESHKQYLNLSFGKYEDKIYTLSGFSGDAGKDIKDPYGMDLFMYKSCAEKINSIIQKVFI